MLDHAYLHKEELRKLYAEEVPKDRMRWYLCNNYLDFGLEIDDSNWNKIQKVLIVNGVVAAYFACSLGRNVGNASSFHTINFKIASSEDYKAALREFVNEVLDKVHTFSFCCVKGSPREEYWDVFVMEYGGDVVGVFPNNSRLRDGELASLKWYSIKGKKEAV